MKRSTFAGAALAASFGVASVCAHAEAVSRTPERGEPQRIVSLNVCADQILLDLVARQRIRAVSFLAADPSVSAVADKARGIAWTRGSAEEVLALEPDLVIAGEHSTPAAVALLERLGLNILKVPTVSDLAGVRSVTRQIARATRTEAQGEALLAEFDRRLAASAATSSASAGPPTAVIYQVNNLSSGPGTLADAVLRAAGFI
ncbi:MAG: ABC transporter substrate-binding protein, partial [bacterium]